MAANESDKDNIARLEEELRRVHASQRVSSMIALQVLMRVAMRAGDPNEYVTSVMDDIEKELLAAARTSDAPIVKQDAEEAVSFLNVLKVATTRSLAKFPQRT